MTSSEKTPLLVHHGPEASKRLRSVVGPTQSETEDDECSSLVEVDVAETGQLEEKNKQL